MVSGISLKQWVISLELSKNDPLDARVRERWVLRSWCCIILLSLDFMDWLQAHG